MWRCAVHGHLKDEAPAKRPPHLAWLSPPILLAEHHLQPSPLQVGEPGSRAVVSDLKTEQVAPNRQAFPLVGNTELRNQRSKVALRKSPTT